MVNEFTDTISVVNITSESECDNKDDVSKDELDYNILINARELKSLIETNFFVNAVGRKNEKNVM